MLRIPPIEYADVSESLSIMGSKKRGIMKQALITGLKSDEWYTPLETVKTMLEIFPPPKGARVLLPFDTEKSNFTKVITQDYDPFAIYGITDFLTNQYEFDYLITNPPYSNKDKIIARCIETGKPCVLVLPIDTLGGYNGINYLAKRI